MVARNTLLAAPPYSVEKALKRLGGNLRTARIRRSLTVEEVAQKIGTGVRAIYDAEKGKPSTSIATYVALLWVFDLLNEFEMLADPSHDTEGLALALSQEGKRASRRKGLNNDF